MNFNFFKKLAGRGAQASLGVDIGTTSIKMVELRRADNKTTLVNYGILETQGYISRANNALQASTLKLFEDEAARYVQILLEKIKAQTRNAVASLPAFAVFSTVLDLPPMPDQEVAQALQFKARQYIPLPISSVSLDWVRIGEQKVLLLAIPNELIEKHRIIFQKAGLALTALEVEGFSLARAFLNTEPTLIIDIGARSTGLFVAAGGALQIMGQTDFSGASLTHAIASGLTIVPQRAEDLKREQGIVNTGFGGAQELSTLLLPLVDVILNEGKRVAERYHVAYGNAVKRVIFSGGGAHLPGLEEYAKRQFDGIAIEKAFPFKTLTYSAQTEAMLMSLGPRLAVATGAALRGVSNL